MKDQKDYIEQKIRQSVEQEPVPESLHPKQIEKMLEKRKKKHWHRWGIAGIVAAAAVAVVTVGAWAGLRGSEPDSKNLTQHLSAKKDGGELTEGIARADSYGEVYRLLKNYYMEDDFLYGFGSKGADVYVEENAVMESEAQFDTVQAQDGQSLQNDYSTTNVQVEGVEEADIMLTDGSCLYLVQGDRTRVKIVQTRQDGTALTQLAEIVPEEETEIEEMYLNGSQLVVIGTVYPQYDENYEEVVQKTKSAAYTYDISDCASPKLQGSLEIEGYYKDSRLTGGYLYLFTEYTDVYEGLKECGKEGDAYIPCVQEETIAAQDIYIPDVAQAYGYLVCASVSLDSPSQTTDQFAVMMSDSFYYVSPEHIFVASEQYGENGTVTEIASFSYENGQIRAEASGRVKGILNNNFSMDEYQGYLRLVTTNYSENNTTNGLYILDEKLNEVSHIGDLAPGETIYSARFMGNTGYFVTYRQVDPLFSVDLTDPQHPHILGELKISGFSEYLHPYGDGKLLGIGWETTPTKTGGVTTDGMKLSMFDISDPANVTEENRMVERQIMSTCVGYDYKSVLVSAEKNLFGFATVEDDGMWCHYRTFRYDAEAGFQVVTDTLLSGTWNESFIRGVYIGNVLYVSDGCYVTAISLDSGEELAELEIR